MLFWGHCASDVMLINLHLHRICDLLAFDIFIPLEPLCLVKVPKNYPFLTFGTRRAIFLKFCNQREEVCDIALNSARFHFHNPSLSFIIPHNPSLSHADKDGCASFG
jgi:hypothetical protein